MNMNRIFNLMMFWKKIEQEHEEIKKDPQTSETSIKLGKTSLIKSIVGMVLSIVCAAIACVCISVDSALIVLTSIGTFLFGFLALVCYVELVLASIVYAVYQMKLNKNKIGKTALIVSIAIAVVTTIAAILLFIYFPGLQKLLS